MNASHNIYLPTLPIQPYSPKWSSDHLDGFRLGLHIFHSLRRFLADIGNGTPIHLAPIHQSPRRSQAVARTAVGCVIDWNTKYGGRCPTVANQLLQNLSIKSILNLLTLQLIHPQYIYIYNSKKNHVNLPANISIDISHHLDILQERWCHCHGPPCRSRCWQLTSMASSPMPR